MEQFHQNIGRGEESDADGVWDSFEYLRLNHPDAFRIIGGDAAQYAVDEWINRKGFRDNYKRGAIRFLMSKIVEITEDLSLDLKPEKRRELLINEAIKLRQIVVGKSEYFK